MAVALRTPPRGFGALLRANRRLLTGWGITLVVALIFPVLLGPTGHVQDVTGDVVEGEIYAMLALGLNVVVGFAGLLDLGYAAFFAIGAYSFGMISSAHFQPASTFNSPIISWGPSGIHANFWLFLPLCAMLAAVFGVLLGTPTLRLRGDYLAIVTLGFGEIVHKVVTNLGPGSTISAFGWPDITGGTNSLDGIFQPTLGGLQFSTDQVPWYYLGLAVACMGINLRNTKLLAFSMGAFFSGFAGVIQGSRLTLVDPTQFTFTVSISILVMVVLGGLGSVPGVVLGAGIIALLQFFLLDKMNDAAHWLANNNLGIFAFLSSIVRWIGSALHIDFLKNFDLSSFFQGVDFTEAQYLIFGIMLVLMMLFRREGLIPSGRRRRELRPSDAGILEEENQQLYDVMAEGS
jgi:branched-chain amino acid transport system permease protein